MKKIDLIGIGAGGHTKVLIDIINDNNKFNILGLISSKNNINIINNIDIIGSDEDLVKFYKKGVRDVFIGIGSIEDTKKNKLIYDNLIKIGFNIISVIHNTAIISNSASLMSGVKVMAGSIINPETVIGNNCIINTGSIIEHDCCLKDHVQIGPGSYVAGNVIIGEGSIIGIGAKIIQGITIGEYSMVAAGAVVTSNIGDNKMFAGIPAKEKKTW